MTSAIDELRQLAKGVGQVDLIDSLIEKDRRKPEDKPTTVELKYRKRRKRKKKLAKISKRKNR